MRHIILSAIIFSLGCVQTHTAPAVAMQNDTTAYIDTTDIAKNETMQVTPTPTATPTPTPTPTPLNMPASTPTPVPCTASWQCSTSPCINDQQNTTCNDTNRCAPATTEIQSCISVNRIIFAEVFYDTPGNESDEEWLKLYNPTNADVQMTNWSLTDNTGAWKFTSFISKKSFLTIARNAGGFKNLTGCSADIAGFTRGLNNDGDYLLLKDSNGEEVDFVAWEKGYKNSHPAWNMTAQQGKSIKRIFLSADTDSVADWIAVEAKSC